MVRWQNRRQSRNVEDRRGAAAGGAGILLMLLRLIIGRFGLRGILILGVIGVGLYMAGINPVTLLQQQTMGAQTGEPIDDEASRFVKAILAETEDVWSQIFAENGADYPEPKLVLFTGGGASGCGFASSSVGPFYCPVDRKVYLDPNFFTALKRRFNVPGDFPGAYVIAHEVGHHVQTVTGISDEVRAAQNRAPNEADRNTLQVMMELQADCYAGIWAHYASRYSNFLEPGDIEEGLAAAAAIGDDTLQKNAGQEVNPEGFTHGTSAQRQRWFTTGYQTGDVNACDTFSAARL